MLKRARGFSLIELMIVVAIIGILAAIAIPAYNDYILRGKLVEAANQLSADRVAMEQFYQDNRAYTTVNALFPTPCGAGGTFAAQTLTGFTMSCITQTVNGVAGYLITATGGKIPSTAGAVYTIDNFGNQITVAPPTVWGAAPNPNTCWVMKRGQTCT